MCGIVGYIGPQDATPIILNGLKRLEYRGYDSAGLAIYQGGRIEIRREAGKLARLTELVSNSPVSGAPGIGHTRCGTDGAGCAVDQDLVNRLDVAVSMSVSVDWGCSPFPLAAVRAAGIGNSRLFDGTARMGHFIRRNLAPC